MGPVPGRLFGIFFALIVALAALSPAGASTPPSADRVPMPPGDFILTRSEHCDIYYDSARTADVSDVVVAADKAYDTVAGFFGSFDYRTKIILASDHTQYVTILTLNVPGAGTIADSEVASSWGDGERGTIVIEGPGQLSNFTTVLAHQLSLIALRTRVIDNKYAIPGWFSEGLAIYVSGDLSSNARAAVEESCRNGKLMTVAQMRDVLDRSTDPAANEDEASLARAQASLLMEYVSSKYTNDSIRLIMQDFGPNGDLDKAFTKRVGYTPEDINADWKLAFKGQVNVKDGLVLSQRLYGYVLDADGRPAANQTVAFTCTRSDPAVYGKTYTATTNGTGYYRLNLTYGQFKVGLAGHDVDEGVEVQKGESRQYNVTLAGAGQPVQNVLAGPETAGDWAVYAVLGALNAAAILLIAFVFLRARK